MRAGTEEYKKSLGITFVHVTHSQEEAMALADIIVIMNDGRYRAGSISARSLRAPGNSLRRPLHGRSQCC